MLQHRVIASTCPWRSVRSASQLRQSPPDDRSPSTTTFGSTESAYRPTSILSRLSDRARIRRVPAIEQKDPYTHIGFTTAAHKTPRSRATSFISVRSTQKRDHAAEKWFTDVRELDIRRVVQPDDLKSLPRKKTLESVSPKQHEMRPRTDLNALFASSTTRSATSLRLQTKRELGSDYTSYLPDGYADPYRHPIAYARLLLGRNKHIPLNAQTDALNIVEEATQGKTTRQAV